MARMVRSSQGWLNSQSNQPNTLGGATISSRVEFPALTWGCNIGILHVMVNFISRACLMFFWLGVSTALQAQVLIYKVDIGGVKGVNFHTFDGGFVVAPLLGGAATFLLTSSEDGRTFTESPDGGNLFTAVTGSGDQKAVVSATTGTGTASGSLVAIGDVNHVIKVNSRTLTLAAKVAKTLIGTLVSADDESDSITTAVDGSIGSAGVADVKLVLDEDQTNSANKDGLSVAEAVDQAKLELERHGFSPEGENPYQPVVTPQ
jgi:hypothetical protein